MNDLEIKHSFTAVRRFPERDLKIVFVSTLSDEGDFVLDIHSFHGNKKPVSQRMIIPTILADSLCIFIGFLADQLVRKNTAGRP